MDQFLQFIFNSREDARYVEGVENPDLIRNALAEFKEPTGISEIFEGTAVIIWFTLQTIQVHGVRIKDHLASNLENQIIRGKFLILQSKIGCLVGNVSRTPSTTNCDRVVIRAGKKIVNSGNRYF